MDNKLLEKKIPSQGRVGSLRRGARDRAERPQDVVIVVVVVVVVVVVECQCVLLIIIDEPVPV